MSAPITSSRLQPAEHYCSAYAVALPDGVSLDDAMRPEFWAHVAGSLRQHDTLRLIPEDGSYFAEALVLGSGRGFVKVKLLRHVPLDEEESAQTISDLVEIKWRGPHSKWSIIRRSDNQVLNDGLDKGDAMREAASYVAKAA